MCPIKAGLLGIMNDTIAGYKTIQGEEKERQIKALRLRTDKLPPIQLPPIVYRSRSYEEQSPYWEEKYPQQGTNCGQQEIICVLGQRQRCLVIKIKPVWAQAAPS